MNRVILVGRLARDPGELRRSTSNVATLSFSVAVDSRSTKEDKTAEFINCVAFNRTAEFISEYFHQGSQIALEGRLQSRSYEKDGRKVYVTEVICEQVQILDPKGYKPGEGQRSLGDSMDQDEPVERKKDNPAYLDIDADSFDLD